MGVVKVQQKHPKIPFDGVFIYNFNVASLLVVIYFIMYLYLLTLSLLFHSREDKKKSGSQTKIKFTRV